jgi:hypothetical protein
MMRLARPPHGEKGSGAFLELRSSRAIAKRIRVALECDQSYCPRRMCRCKERRWRERGGGREYDRLTTPEIVKHRGDAVSPLLQVRQRAGRGSYAVPDTFWLSISGSVKAPSGWQKVTSITGSSTPRRRAAPWASKHADPNVYSGRLEMDDIRESQNFVSEMARRYGGHR